MKRSYGTHFRFGVGLKRAISSTHIVTVDFNPPKLKYETFLRNLFAFRSSLV